jgi:hypothetical protein
MACPIGGVLIGDAMAGTGQCVHLLDTSIEGNRVIGGYLAGVTVEGLTDSGAMVKKVHAR